MELTQTAPPRPSISVVIPTRDRPDDLWRCLDSLTGVAYTRWDIALIDQSTDTRTRDVTLGFQRSLPNLTYHHNVEKGLSRARNKGIVETTGDVVAFLDDDCIVQTDWLEQIAAAFARHPDAAMVFGSVTAAAHDPDNYFVLTYMPPYERVLEGRQSRIRARGVGASMYLRRSLMNVVGPFDVHLGAGADIFPNVEDADYAYRALALGLSIVETPAICITHYGLRSYGSGESARDTRGQIHAEAGLNMKLLRCGDPSALGLIIVRGAQLLAYISWRNLLTRRGPTGLARIAMYLRGLYDSFLLPVDRKRCLYAPARSHRA